MEKYDIEAKVKNCRQSKNFFSTKFRPTFDIHKDYASSGEISLIGRDKLTHNEESLAFIRFLSPEVYPKSIWIGKKIIFKEGNTISGYAIVTKIFNKILESETSGIEGNLNLKKN